MKLKYTNTDSVVIGSHTQDEHKYQVANHFNMVENGIKDAISLIRDFRSKFSKDITFDMGLLLNQIEHHIGNAQAQHFNEGLEIKSIDDIGIISI